MQSPGFGGVGCLCIRDGFFCSRPVPVFDIVQGYAEYRDIASEERTEADLPGEVGGWANIASFAMTFDEFDPFEECFEASSMTN
ncbi:hypothetical protein [Aneurinibacillus migulanus]|uniref:hypothetical protein n=1 Tax=Aneurinibacillus migulanus TaxID=47500 RepID=UPI0020A12CC0|nr:hypothetical protein [Aneurinibacillus migulanus]MCP1359104.1 hypothetical protein [Aneurinibacillus migulanus]